MVVAPTAAVVAAELKWGAEAMLGAAIRLEFFQMELVSGGDGISSVFRPRMAHRNCCCSFW